MARQKIKFERLGANFDVGGSGLGFKLEHSSDATIINVQGVIGDEWDGLRSIEIVSEIQKTDRPIVLRLNTPGGFVNDALDVYDALVEHPHNVRADIVAEAWSAGTILSAAADEVRIRSAARFGVHRAWGGALVVGNVEELADQIKVLEHYREQLLLLDDQIAQLLADRSGNTQQQVMEWMVGPDGVDGTEFIGKQAVDAGFADSLIPNKEKGNKYKQQMRAAGRKRLLEIARNRLDRKPAVVND
jgi:ATP-dependent Clp protease, protease subunit